MIQGKKKGVDNQLVKGAQFAYAFDDIGNRKRDSADNNVEQYDSDLLNRYKTMATSGKSITIQYEADGNLISDGQRKYAWNVENRLIGMECVAGVPPADQKRPEFEYDWQSRRISKKVYEGKNDKPELSRVFVYEGWNLVADQDDEVGLLYYAYRYYSTVHGKWISRDPVEERNEINVYCHINNQSINATGYLRISFNLVNNDNMTLLNLK